jgi:hypothetical protein
MTGDLRAYVIRVVPYFAFLDAFGSFSMITVLEMGTFLDYEFLNSCFEFIEIIFGSIFIKSVYSKLSC